MISVSNIERFAIHDGPGIRTTIFLKGCPLHCPWCANPETWTIQPVLMHDEKKCVHCQSCKKECKQDAILFNPNFIIDYDKCISCGKCVDACIPEALSLSGKEMEIEEILDEIIKDDKYYQKSNGGITISGGEPFFQFEQSFEFIKKLKEKGYHVAVETTGMISLENLIKVEPYIDLFLHDIKHLDFNKLFEITGANLNVILNNLDYLSSKCKEKVIIRVPVIPNFNQDILEDIILFSKEKGFKEVNLLPYHPLGKNKWHNLQRDYKYEDYKMMNKEELKDYIEFGHIHDIPVKIGG